jgi:DNA-binding response OmpR family regulator
VLLVEDEDSFVDALTVGLKREGFHVTVARDGAEALDVFDVAQPDLVLLDVMLPKVSGIDVCREIRSRSQVPIIMVTAKSAEIDTVVGPRWGPTTTSPSRTASASWSPGCEPCCADRPASGCPSPSAAT